MRFGINDSMVSEFLSGLIIVLALIAVGGLIALILKKMADRYPFTRLALILALTPLSLLQFIDFNTKYLLFTYSMIAVLMGITIDGLKFLFESRMQRRLFAAHESVTPAEEPAQAEESSSTEEQSPSVLVWERAE